jgi:hypothetical protein
MSYRSALAVALTLAAAASIAVAAPEKSRKKPAAKVARKASVSVTPKQENQFVTVEEFVKGGRAAGTPVSVEGYAVIGIKSGSGVKLAIVDSVDHVLSTADADKYAAGGASAVIPASALAGHGNWGMSAKGMSRFSMYTGAGHAQKPLHDTVAKMRITGRASGRSISPVTCVEYQDDNGDWKKL